MEKLKRLYMLLACISIIISVANAGIVDPDTKKQSTSNQNKIAPKPKQQECIPNDDDGEGSRPNLIVTPEISTMAKGYGLWGDMLLPLDYFSNTTKGVTSDVGTKWPDAVVPYVIHASLVGQTSLIEGAMQEYHRKTCIRFVPRTKRHRNYINIFYGEGCYSLIGMTDQSGQPVSLGNGCLHHGTVVHELGHVLGFFHEQNRSDRDDHIIVYWSNIQSGMESQFYKVGPSDEIKYTNYDVDSIMHYGERSFSRDGMSRTMQARNGQRLSEPYNKGGLTPSDVREIRAAYQCY